MTISEASFSSRARLSSLPSVTRDPSEWPRPSLPARTRTEIEAFRRELNRLHLQVEVASGPPPGGCGQAVEASCTETAHRSGAVHAVVEELACVMQNLVNCGAILTSARRGAAGDTDRAGGLSRVADVLDSTIRQVRLSLTASVAALDIGEHPAAGTDATGPNGYTTQRVS